MKTALVIVDAYEKQFKEHDTEIVNSICPFINHVCNIEREKGTVIIHSLGKGSPEYYEPMEEYITKNSINSLIEFHDKDCFTSSEQLHEEIKSKNIEKVYFAGFHFGKCVHYNLNELYGHFKNDTSVSVNNLVLNLSMILKGDSEKQTWHYSIKTGLTVPHVGYPPPPHYNYNFWGPSGFEGISLK